MTTRASSRLVLSGLVQDTASSPTETGMEIDGLVVTSVLVDEEEDVSLSLTLTLDAMSADRLAAFTAAHVGLRVQVLVGEEVILEPRISSPIAGGVVVVTMGLLSVAMRIADLLRSPGAVLSIRIAH